MEYDKVFINAKIIDGTGDAAYLGTVGVSGDRITEVVHGLKPLKGKEIIDLKNKALCPGFIDVHSHSDVSILHNNNPRGKIYQGITTELIGNCGYSVFPLKKDSSFIKKRRESLGFIDIDDVDWSWTNLDEYIERLQAIKPNTNLGLLIGHGSIRSMVKDYQNSCASSVEMEQMKDILAAHFEQGVFGISTGLGYAPDFYSNTSELIELGKTVKEYDKVFTFHVRGDRQTLFNAVREALEVGAVSGAKIQISHLKCPSPFNYGRAKEIIHVIENAQNKGVQVKTDMYPYAAGSSYLGLVFPPWVHAGGIQNFLERLQDKSLRPRIFTEMMTGVDSWSSLLSESNGANLVISNLSVDTHLIGKNLFEIAELNSETVQETSARLMIENGGGVEMIIFNQREEDMREIATFHDTLFGTDGLAMDYVSEPIRSKPHPRNYGSFPKVLNMMVEKEKLFSLENAVNRFSHAAAQWFGFKNRGLIKKNFYADIVIFDEKTIRDHATFEDPHKISEGIEYMYINGVPIIRESQHLNTPNGMILFSDV